ncbi:hypothetical protein ACQPTN_34950 [Bradyrhizobium sp. 13971]
MPNHAAQWEWKCGFYPGSNQSTGGPAATFDDARAGFEAAWGELLPTLTEADFQAWRDHHNWIARKQAMWDRGEKLPSQQPSSLMRCPAARRLIASGRKPNSHPIYAAQRRDGIRR